MDADLVCLCNAIQLVPDTAETVHKIAFALTPGGTSPATPPSLPAHSHPKGSILPISGSARDLAGFGGVIPIFIQATAARARLSPGCLRTNMLSFWRPEACTWLTRHSSWRTYRC